MFKCILRLQSEEALHIYYKGGEVPLLPEARLKVLLILLLLRRLETLLWQRVPVVEGVRVHGTHVVNTFYPFLPEVVGQKVSLLIQTLKIYGWVVDK